MRNYESYRQCDLQLQRLYPKGYHRGKDQGMDSCDVVLRLRDDAVLHRPMDIPYLHALTNASAGIVASACAQYRGLNDHGAMVHPSVAQKYFSLPSEEKEKKIGKDVISPEHYLSWLYTKFSLPITVSDYFGPLLRLKFTEGV